MTKKQFLQTVAKHASASGKVPQIIVSVHISRKDVPGEFDDLVDALDEDSDLANDIIGLYLENACAQAGISTAEIVHSDPVEYELRGAAEDEEITVWRCFDL